MEREMDGRRTRERVGEKREREKKEKESKGKKVEET
jgi:hypothetical protein